MKNCPNCKGNTDPDKNFKCKDCGEIFWQSEEIFKEHLKKQQQKEAKLNTNEPLINTEKNSKTLKVNLIAILISIFSVSVFIPGRLGILPQILIVFVLYWIIKIIILETISRNDSYCPDCKPDQDYKCKSCGKVFWRTKELYEQNHKSEILELKDSEEFTPPKQLEIESKQNKKSKRKWIIAVVFFVVLIFSIVITITLNTPNNEDIDISLKKTNKSSEYSEQIGNMYRNTKYKFRIKFPEGWKIEVGDGLHVVQKASFENSIISVIVQQLDLGPNEGFYSIKDTGNPIEFIDSMMDGIKEKASNIQIIDYGETKIDNEPAYWVEYSATSQILDYQIKMTQLIYFLAKGYTLYSINAGTLTDEYSKIKPLFTQAVGTFVLEDY